MKNRLFTLGLCAIMFMTTIFIFNKNAAAEWLDKLSGLFGLESFEGNTFPPDGWSKIITPLKGTGWGQGSKNDTIPGMGFFGPVGGGAPSGGDMFAFASWATGDSDRIFTTDQPTDQWLITPQISGIEVGDSLLFYVKTFGVFNERLDILVSTTNADSIHFFDTTIVSLSFDESSGSDWQAQAVDLSFFAGSDIYLAFREHISATLVLGDAILLDLVEVTSLITNVEQRNHEPEEFLLSQNYPNPFNPTTQIRFTLPKAAEVTLKVYNIAGQLITTLAQSELYTAGAHTVQFNASLLPNGIYYYRLEAGGFVDVRKMTLLK